MVWIWTPIERVEGQCDAFGKGAIRNEGGTAIFKVGECG